MREPYSRLFQTQPEVLTQMLVLRMSGVSLRALTALYTCDRTTIRHWIVKYGIKPKMLEIPHNLLPEILGAPVPRPRKRRDTRIYKYQDIFDQDEDINPGKSYREYVEDHKRRDPKYRFIRNPYAPEL